MKNLIFVFDRIPDNEGCNFIEVENEAGESVCAGEWRLRDDGLAELVVPVSYGTQAETLRADTAEAERNHAKEERDSYQRIGIAAEQRVYELEKVLGRIARPHDCGCWPCMGSCVSQEALQITVDEMRDRAGAALNPTSKEESHE